MRPLTISVVIPVRNGAADLPFCLESLYASTHKPDEVLVVDDGSTDASKDIARQFGAQLLETEGARGPAVARNLGAQAATSDIVFFVDADVCLHADAVARVLARFSKDTQLDALMGSYDDEPAVGDFLSQYKNLLHCYVHRTSNPEARTFWTGIGAIRRTVFVSSGGFDEAFGRPSVEDIDFGLRLCREGRHIALDASIQGKHRKRYSFSTILRVDVLDRGIPWMELVLREGRMPNDLNLKWSQRLSVLLVWLLVAKLALSAAGALSNLALGGLLVLAVADICAIIILNLRLYRFYFAHRGLGFTLRVIPMNFLFHFYNGLSAIAAVLRHFIRTLQGEPMRDPVPVREPLDDRALR